MTKVIFAVLPLAAVTGILFVNRHSLIKDPPAELLPIKIEYAAKPVRVSTYRSSTNHSASSQSTSASQPVQKGLGRAELPQYYDSAMQFMAGRTWRRTDFWIKEKGAIIDVVEHGTTNGKRWFIHKNHNDYKKLTAPNLGLFRLSITAVPQYYCATEQDASQSLFLRAS